MIKRKRKRKSTRPPRTNRRLDFTEFSELEIALLSPMQCQLVSLRRKKLSYTQMAHLTGKTMGGITQMIRVAYNTLSKQREKMHNNLEANRSLLPQPVAASDKK